MRRVAGVVSAVVLIAGLAWAVPQLFALSNGEVDVTADDYSGDGDAGAVAATDTASDEAGVPGDDPSKYDADSVQEHFLRFYNQERHSRSLVNVSISETLSEMGQSHADNMRRHGYVGHEQPDGSTIASRFEQRGLLPKCRIPTESGKYYPGAENAAGSDVVDPTTSAELDQIYEINTERQLAEYLFKGWMASAPHRRAMLEEDVRTIGLGISINEKGEVYAALEMCGS